MFARARQERIKWYAHEAMESDARAMAVMPPDVLGLIWQRWLGEKAPGTRPELCGDLAVMMPVVAALGGPEAVFGLTRAVLDVGRWWP